MKNFFSILSILLISFAMLSCGESDLSYAKGRAEANIKIIKKYLKKPLTDTRTIPNPVRETAFIKQKLKISEIAKISEIHTLQAEALYSMAEDEIDSDLASRIKMFAREMEKESKAIFER